MRVALVTSSITYVKDNYYYLIKNLLENRELSPEIKFVSLIFINSFSFKLIIKCLIIFIAGGFNFSLTLLKNIFLAFFFDKRKKSAEKLKIPVFKFNNINDEKAIYQIKKLNPDLIINMRTRNIYKNEILSIPKIGCVNIHHGILPDNRGTMCDLWAWYRKKPVGFSIHWMNEKIDDGKIIAVKEIDISKIKNYIEIPFLSSINEAIELAQCLKDIGKNKKISGKNNIAVQKNYTKNPSLKEIRDIIKSGLKL